MAWQKNLLDNKGKHISPKTGWMENKQLHYLLDDFNNKDVFVVNDTLVFPDSIYERNRCQN